MNNSTIGTNVFEGIPEKGTVVAVLSNEQLENFKGIDADSTVLNASPTLFTKEETYLIVASRQGWWTNICETNNIPYSWPISLDLVTGNIYIGDSIK